MKTTLFIVIAVLLLAGTCLAGSATGKWLDDTFGRFDSAVPVTRDAYVRLIKQDDRELQINKSVMRSPITLGARQFKHGLGTHAASEICVYSHDPIVRFTAFVGLDNNWASRGNGSGSVVFAIKAAGNEVYRSGVLRCGQEAERVDVALNEATELRLLVEPTADGLIADHADWAEATVTTKSGEVLRLDQMQLNPNLSTTLFSFIYNGQASQEILGSWETKTNSAKLDESRTEITKTWTDAKTGLVVRWEAVRYSDAPALEWLLTFENTGKSDTPIVSGVQALDVTLDPINPDVPFVLHRIKGAVHRPCDYVVSDVALHPNESVVLGGRQGLHDLAFQRIETGRGSAMIGIGWSGQWKMDVSCLEDGHLRVTTGLERTNFLLHPGEKVRMPRILMLFWDGHKADASAAFRKLVFKHYCAKYKGQDPRPYVYMNTCFTRGGGWLNETTEQNQISLIRALQPLKVDGVITDAGWFPGGWPKVGTWEARKDNYPNGIGPVAAAAKECGTIYGLWFEPERVSNDTKIMKQHPEWLLRMKTGSDWQPGMLNFGHPDVPEAFFRIVDGFFKLPGFEVYRQDCNINGLSSFWQDNDAPDRVGITEMKYFAGLYAYWDKIITAYPNSFREVASTGNPRIDLETVMRFHMHQPSELWFNAANDQASHYALGQFLPNGLFMCPVNSLDEYTLHSAMDASLCLGWIADDPEFDMKRAKAFIDSYREIAPIFNGEWYALTPYNGIDGAHWTASQYYLPEQGRGVILAFRRPESQYKSIEVSLRGLDADASYELSFASADRKVTITGKDLMSGYELWLPRRGQSELIVYRRAD